VLQGFFAEDEPLGFSPLSLSWWEARAGFLVLIKQVKATQLLAMPSCSFGFSVFCGTGVRYPDFQ
jgi:hypothetical protein